MSNDELVMMQNLVIDPSISVSFAQGQTPVLPLDTMRICYITVATVNALRAGSPHVQIVVCSNLMKSEKEDLRSAITTLLGSLTLSGESFEVTGEFESDLADEVMVISRKKI